MIKNLVLVILALLSTLTIQGQNFYVSQSGSDTGPGSYTEPFRTIQHAVNQLSPGDTLFIRGGSYHEEVVISNLSGTPGAGIVITAYPGEEVIMDGTIPIESSWEIHQGSIYKTTIEEDIWQLFVEGRMQVIARWPNASTHPVDPISRVHGTWDAEGGTWWSRETTWASADAAGTLNGVVENNSSLHNLAGTGKSFAGGSVLLSVLEQGGDGNQERPVIAHEAGSSIIQHPVIYPPKPDKAYRTNGKFYLIEHLDALDLPEEWYFIDSTNTLYLWPGEDQDPNTLNIRGRNQSRAFNLTGVSYIRIKGLNFFAANFSIAGNHVAVEDCVFNYPDASKRLVGIYPTNSTDASTSFGTYINGESFSLVNCEFRFTEYNVLKVENGTGSRIENNLFYNLSMLGLGKNGAIEQVNTYTRNSLITSGCRGAVKTNTDPVSGRIQTHNLFDGFGYMQVPDGAALQAATSKTPGTIRSHNWFLNAPKYGSRWDGKPAGRGGLNHHSVGLRVRATLQVKGNEHHSYNNSSFDTSPYNDIIVLSDPVYGGNTGSFTFNNLADRISGHRSETVFTYPLPGTHGNNWNGYKQERDANLQVRDVENRDFRPRPGSDIVDVAMEIPGITDGFIGSAPDIGAYEFGDSVYWIPGRKSEDTSNPVPLHNGTTNYEFVDLMWLEGYKSQSSDVYFGSSEDAVRSAGHGSPEFRGNQFNNIFHPGSLEAGQTYFWRVDAVQEKSTVKGQVWSFTAGLDSNPEVFSANFLVSGRKRSEIAPLEGAEITMGDRRAFSGADGAASLIMLKKGTYLYEIKKNDYHFLTDTIHIISDTLVVDTLLFSPVDEFYQAEVRVIDKSSEEPVYRAQISFGENLELSNDEGKATLKNIPPGYLVYTVVHNDYFIFTDSVLISSDTSLVIRIISRMADIRFEISYEKVPVEGAMVELNGYLSLVTDDNGKVKFINQLARQKYGYSVIKEGYKYFTDSLYLGVDTVVNVNLEPLTGLKDQSHPGIKIYPMPARDQLYIQNPFGEAILRVICVDGKVVMERKIHPGTNSLDISREEDGIYYVRIMEKDHVYFGKLLIHK